MRNKVLRILLENMGKNVSGESISNTLGITRAAIWKHIKKLQEQGAKIESTTGGGYCLLSVPDWLNEEIFRSYAEDINIHIVDDTPSTNSLCQKISDENDNNIVVIANTQSKGKGRLHRQWTSPTGGVWMSILVRPNLTPNAIPPITLLTAAAVCKALEEIFQDIKINIKWPNDIYLDGKKLCGILVEANADIDGVRHVVIGIGVNANNSVSNLPDDIKNTAATLKGNGYTTTRAHIASVIYKHVIELINQYEESNDLSFVREYYTQHLTWQNQNVVLKNMGLNKIEESGILLGIGNMGELIIDCDGMQKKIISGELSLREAKEE